MAVSDDAIELYGWACMLNLYWRVRESSGIGCKSLWAGMPILSPLPLFQADAPTLGVEGAQGVLAVVGSDDDGSDKEEGEEDEEEGTEDDSSSTGSGVGMAQSIFLRAVAGEGRPVVALSSPRDDPQYEGALGSILPAVQTQRPDGWVPKASRRDRILAVVVGRLTAT